MATTKATSCRKCFQPINSRATKCHHCGSPQSRFWGALGSVSIILGILTSTISVVGAVLTWNYKEQVETALNKAVEANKKSETSLKIASQATQDSNQAITDAIQANANSMVANETARLLKEVLNNTKADIATFKRETNREREQFLDIKEEMNKQQVEAETKIRELTSLATDLKSDLENLVLVHRNDRGFAIDFDEGIRIQWGVITVNEPDQVNHPTMYPFPFKDENVTISMTYRDTNNTTLQDKVLLATNVTREFFIPKITGKEIIGTYNALNVDVSYIAIGNTPEN